MWSQTSGPRCTLYSHECILCNVSLLISALMHQYVCVFVWVCRWLYVALSSALQEGLHHVNGQGENDGGVLLGCDGVEGLEVAQLQS